MWGIRQSRLLIIGCTAFTALISAMSSVAGPVSPCFRDYIVQLAARSTTGPAWPLSTWSQQISDTWLRLFQNSDFDVAGRVVEVAPGFSPKLGAALKELGFRGTLYVIEPDHAALQAVTGLYRTLLPRAKIIPIKAKLSQAIPMIRKNVDALVATHPIDDMILAEALSDSEFRRVFDALYTRDQETLEAVRSIWTRLEKSPGRLAEIKKTVEKDWGTFIRKVNPKLVGIAQHRSRTFRDAGFMTADDHALDVIRTLRRSTGSNSTEVHRVLLLNNQDPERWIFASRDETKLSELTHRNPRAVERLGSGAFIETQGYRPALDPDQVIGIDLSLLRSTTGEMRTVPDDALIKSAARELPVDLESDGKHIGTVRVFVDKQADPMEIALSGNGGSGRAGYTGRNFNYKSFGRTPLAHAAPSDAHGSGRGTIQEAAWEMIAGNTAHRNLRTGASPVVAIFDLRKNYTHQGSARRMASLVRKDQGALDRPTHYFLAELSERELDLDRVAVSFGKQDAEKFIEKIIHGTWSAGNISIDGRMLDFASVSAVFERAPQYTLMGNLKYPENLFGFERKGQLRIIQELAKARKQDGPARLKALETAFDAARSDHLKARMLDLFGMDPSLQISILANHDREISALAREFDALSGLMYPQFEAMSHYSMNKNKLPVLEFSRFFRYFPLHRLNAPSGSIEELGMKLLFNDRGTISPIHDQRIHSRVHEALGAGARIIDNQERLDAVRARARSFIRNYEALLRSVQKEGLLDQGPSQAIRAFIVNQERQYLDNGYMTVVLGRLTGDYEAGRMKASELRRYIDLFIDANDRVAVLHPNGTYRSNYTIYRNGYSYRELSLDGKQRLILHPFSSEPADATAKWELRTKSGVQQLQYVKLPTGQTELRSPEGALTELISGEPELAIYRDNKLFELQDLLQ